MKNFIHIALKDRRKAKVYTAVLMVLFFTLLLLPFFSYQNPPPGQEGLLVSFGQIEAGQGSEAAAPPAAKPDEEVKPEKPKEKPKVKPVKKPEESKPKPKPKKVETPVDEDVISAKNEAIALKKQKQKEEAEQKAKEDALAKIKAAEEAAEKARLAEAQRIKEEKAARIAAAAAKKQKEADDLKSSLAGAFGKGSGRGDGGKPGNQGVEDGDPNAEALKGLNTGIGSIGGGLLGRGGKGPGIKDNSNKTGKVVVNVCIDAKGNVVSVKFTQKGSTSSDPELIKLATDNANKWSFNSGISDTTCGTITYDFKVK